MPSAAPAIPSNVVLITLDTTRADALGVYGQVLPTTPNIDRMSAEGVRFSHAMSAAPSTLPSHATILTGKLPFAHGVRSNHGYALADQHETLAEVLQSRGYATAAEIAAPVIGRQTRLDQGFDRYRDTTSAQIRNKEMRVIEGKVVVDPSVRLSKSFDTIQLDERTATDITDRGIEFIRAHRKRHFFLWLHYFDPHTFYLPPADSFAQIPDDPYLAEVNYADAQIGRVLDQLRGLGLAASTLVVLAADHGEGRDEHGENTHVYFVYDTTMRVPLVMWGPALLGSGNTVDALVRTADIVPTVLDLLGLPPLGGIQGVSLRPLIDGRVSDLELTGYGESIEITKLGASMLRFIQRDRWKYIHKVNPELYDIDEDPSELSNLAAVHPDIVEQLRDRLERLIASVDVPSDARVAVSAEVRAQLRALGYLSAAPTDEREDSFANIDVNGVDPLELRDDIRLVATALRAQKRKVHDEVAARFLPLWNKHRVGFFGVERAEALVALGRLNEAVEQHEQVVAHYPETADYRLRLGGVLIMLGRLDDAKKHLRVAFTIDPCEPTAVELLAHIAFLQARYRDQYDTLRTAVEGCAEAKSLMNNFAYALATSTDDSLRDGARALELAGRVAELDTEDDAGHIDTLAVAHAEVGNFTAAVSASKAAIELESAKSEPALLAELEAHLALFEAGQPVRDPSP